MRYLTRITPANCWRICRHTSNIAGDIKNKTVTWIGDGNNMCHSYINAARLLDFNLRIACPKGYEPDTHILKSAPNKVEIY